MKLELTLSGAGALTGLAAGAALRAGVVWWHVRDVAAPETFWIVPLSALIGAGVGGLAGATGKALVGATIGAGLAFVSYLMTVLPLGLFLCCLTFNQSAAPDPPHPLLITLTGAIAGALGGGLAEWLRHRDARSSTHPEVGREQTPADSRPAVFYDDDEDGPPPTPSAP